MNKQLKDLLIIWNHNIHLVKRNDYERKTHYQLFQYCVDVFIKKYGDLPLKNLILEISERDKELRKSVNDLEFLIRCFHYKYHLDVLKIKSNDKKYTFEGRNQRNIFQVIVNRELIITSNKITAKKFNQKELDFYIVKQYIDDYNQNQKSFHKEYVRDYEYKFIFYQINLYINTTYRIKQWFNLIQHHKELLAQPEKLVFLQKVFHFFKEFKKIDSEFEQQQLWYNHYKKCEKFKYFNEYFKKENSHNFGENLISLFKTDYYKKLIESFENKLKSSINQNEFIKSQIKQNHELLRNNDKFRLSRDKSYPEVYSDLVNSNRENYYYEIDLSKLAGETEAIIQFINYLENLTVKEKRVKVSSPVISESILLPLEIFENTRGYLKKNISQINICYKYKAYDACFVLLRKVTEILIIELYEKEKIEDRIKDTDGYYFMLGKLISTFQKENEFKKFNSRKINEYLPKIKANGDLSAHSRKYNAHKVDIDSLRLEFRVVFEELIHSIY